MDRDLIVELVGYGASALIVVSVTRTSILKLRVFGLAGAVVFVAYGIVIRSYPIVAVNAVIAGIQAYFLAQIFLKKREMFTILEVDPDSRYLGHFLTFYRNQIRDFQPGFVYAPSPNQIRLFVLRDLVPAGLVIGRIHDDGSLEIELDFVIPQYRDFRIAEFLYEPRSEALSGVTRVMAQPGSEMHNRYLERTGFRRQGTDGRVTYVKELGATVT